MLELFVAGAIGFWIVVVAVNIALLFFTEYIQPGWATCTMIGVLVFLYYTKTFDAIKYAVQHPWDLVLYVLIYLAVGAGWGVIKWYFYLLKSRDKYQEFRRKWLDSKRIKGTDIPDNLKEEWARNSASYGIKIPQAINNKDRIILWMAYWPWSVIWTALDDVVKRAFERIYSMFGKLYDRMTASVFREFKDDLPSDK